MSGSDIANELEERMIEFAVHVIHAADSLPKTSAGRQIAGQMLRSGTAPAPNYAEARGAESTADFAHKLKIVSKELNETSIWIPIIICGRLLKAALLQPLLDENLQLCRIVNASISTAKSRRATKHNDTKN